MQPNRSRAWPPVERKRHGPLRRIAHIVFGVCDVKHARLRSSIFQFQQNRSCRRRILDLLPTNLGGVLRLHHLFFRLLLVLLLFFLVLVAGLLALVSLVALVVLVRLSADLSPGFCAYTSAGLAANIAIIPAIKNKTNFRITIPLDLTQCITNSALRILCNSPRSVNLSASPVSARSTGFTWAKDATQIRQSFDAVLIAP